MSKPLLKRSRLRATPVEDMLIMRGIQLYKRDFKAVVLFLQRNGEVMGNDLQAFYSAAGKAGDGGFKKAMERVRKRAAKLLSKSQPNQLNSVTTNIEEEFDSNANDDIESSAEENDNEQTDSLCLEIDSNDMRFSVDAQGGTDGLSTPGDVLAKAMQPDEKTGSRKRKRIRKSDNKEKLSHVLESLPGLISAATKAAEQHSKAIKKWADTIADSSSSSNE